MTAFLRNNYPGLRPTDTAAVLAQYPLAEAVPRHGPWFSSASQAYGEATFICPALNSLDAHADNGSRTAAASQWGYRYNVHDAANDAAGLGVPHLFEAAAIFGPDNIGGAPLELLLVQRWVSAARHGLLDLVCA